MLNSRIHTDQDVVTLDAVATYRRTVAEIRDVNGGTLPDHIKVLDANLAALEARLGDDRATSQIADLIVSGKPVKADRLDPLISLATRTVNPGGGPSEIRRVAYQAAVRTVLPAWRDGAGHDRHEELREQYNTLGAQLEQAAGICDPQTPADAALRLDADQRQAWLDAHDLLPQIEAAAELLIRSAGLLGWSRPMVAAERPVHELGLLVTPGERMRPTLEAWRHGSWLEVIATGAHLHSEPMAEVEAWVIPPVHTVQIPNGLGLQPVDLDEEIPEQYAQYRQIVDASSGSRW